jgi:hypothetical protein
MANKTKLTYVTKEIIIKVEDFHRVTPLSVFVIMKERHVKKDCLMWKRILKEENKDCKPKVKMNMVTIDYHN